MASHAWFDVRTCVGFCKRCVLYVLVSGMAYCSDPAIPCSCMHIAGTTLATKAAAVSPLSVTFAIKVERRHLQISRLLSCNGGCTAAGTLTPTRISSRVWWMLLRSSHVQQPKLLKNAKYVSTLPMPCSQVTAPHGYLQQQLSLPQDPAVDSPERLFLTPGTNGAR